MKVFVQPLHFQSMDECRDNLGQELHVGGYLPLEHTARQVMRNAPGESSQQGCFAGSPPPLQVNIFYRRKFISNHQRHHLRHIVLNSLHAVGIYLRHQSLVVALVALMQALDLLVN